MFVVSLIFRARPPLFARVFSPNVRSPCHALAGSLLFHTSEEEEEDARTNTHIHSHAHTHLLSSPVELCSDHQAGSPEGRQAHMKS